jgi:hypothetical protein
MSFDASAAASAAAPTVYAGYGASLTDAAQIDQARFSQALSAAAAAQPTAAVTPPSGAGLDAIQGTMKGVMQALESVNGEATQLGQAASDAQAHGARMSPGEMVMLTMRCQEFMFHCQLTSNIANRTSDGLQQLFRQQG